MSRFFVEKYSSLEPYTPGEQPKDMQYTKLNTNESPFPPSKKAVAAAAEAAKRLQLYPDPECKGLVETATAHFGVERDEILFTNGSDEILNFAFMAFCDERTPAVFPDITYGFYSVFADLNNVPYRTVPLREDFSVCAEDYLSAGGTVFLANPNAPTGLTLSVTEIEKIVQANPDNVVVIDEAYVDFGAGSVVPLIHKYDNLLVTQTFSKSRSMAGARLGFGVGCKELIRDLNAVKYSTNPYNINAMTMAAGIGVLMDEEYTGANCKEIIRLREKASAELENMGFTMTRSNANFIFAKHGTVGGKEIYLRLKEKGVLVRHFEKPRLYDYNRITVGNEQQMDILLEKLREILEEEK